MSNLTVDYYNNNTCSYIQKTFHEKLNGFWDVFERYLTEGSKVLDAGCGSGRDTLHFISKGYDVTSLDASIEMVKHVQALPNTKAVHKTFQEIDANSEFDGIWCHASLLHVETEDYGVVFNNLHNALKPNGVLYMSFKSEDWDGVDDHGRYYYDMNEKRFIEHDFESRGWKVEKTWLQPCPLKGKVNENRVDWFCVILRKV